MTKECTQLLKEIGVEDNISYKSIKQISKTEDLLEDITPIIIKKYTT
jgi:hypothetical protein